MSVIDTEQPGSLWQLSVRLVEAGEMGRRTAKAFLARPDHKFASLTGRVKISGVLPISLFPCFLVSLFPFNSPIS
jgi:hypothetical protein